MLINDLTQTLNILIVDDSQSDRTTLGTIIRSYGCNVIESGSGTEALEYFLKLSGKIDLILLDVVMPNMNGFETSLRIRDIEKTRNDEWCPIIFLSGKSDAKHIKKGIESGGDDYIAKPINTTILKAKINAMQRISNMRKDLITTKKQLYTLANTDELTKLPNRRCFNKVLENEISRSLRYNIPLSLAYMDLDHFKKINDTYGHDFGDTVLQSIAKLFTNNLRSEDSIARIGGEELCICLPGANARHSIKPCERYRCLIEALIIHDKDKNISVTASFGLTSFIPSSDDSNSLIIRADKALFLAKKNGRNRIEII